MVMVRTTSCPDASRWQALLADGDPADSAELEAHLASCTRCQSVLDDLAVGSSGWLRDAGRLATSSEYDPEITRTLHRLRDDEHLDVPISLDFLTRSDQPGVLGTLGRYQVLEVLGRGAFGIVLKALDPDLLRPVAIKVLAPYLAHSGTARQRFIREARAAAAVSHDHVVKIHGVETSGQLPYLVMEYVTGISLQSRLDRDGPLSPREIARIGHQAACGLGAAHEQGLVHRDIKPGNILLENGVERVKITDFGLARAADDARLTQSGTAAGTPLYMSPEQARGENVDHRSDLFSLGSVLYALATGFPPFRADSTMGVLNRIGNDPPRPIRQTNPDFPAALEKIIMQLLEKDQAKRFQLAADVSFRLAGFLSRPPAETDPIDESEMHEASQRSKMWVTVLCLLAAAALVAIVLTFKTPKGTLVVEIDDPAIEVAIAGEELSIKGAGVRELRLRPGDYELTATKDGKVVDQQVVTITKNGKQVVKVTVKPEPVSTTNTWRDLSPKPSDLMQERMKVAFPDAGATEPLVLMLTALQEAKSKATVVHVARDGPVPQTHQGYKKLQDLMLEADKAVIEPDKLRSILKEAHTLAVKIIEDTNASTALTRGKKTPKMDAAWESKLDDLARRFTDLTLRLTGTSAGSLIVLPGPITDLDKAVSAVPGPERDNVKKLLALRDQFALLLPRAQQSAIRLHELKDMVAHSMRASLAEMLDTQYATLSEQLKEMEKLAIALGAKPAAPAAGEPAKTVDANEAEFKKVMAEYDDLLLRLAKTRVGRVLATIPVDRSWGDAELQNEFGSNETARIEQARKLLTLRGQIYNQARQAQNALTERKSRLLSKSAGGVIPGIDDEIKKNEQEIKFRTAAIRGIVDDLKTLANEIDPPAKGPAESGKNPRK
jgi:hypothetical protein